MKSNLLYLIIVTLIASSCASKSVKKSTEPGKTSESAKTAEPVTVIAPSAEAKQLASEQETSFVTEFEFQKGKDTLGAQSKKQIEELSKQALKKGKIEMIKVITWADQEYPSAKRKKLSTQQVALAQKRNNEIKTYLKKIFPNQDVGGKIELISMAERPSFYNKLISSDDARIKRSLETSGIPTTETGKIKNGKTSRSIVLIVTEQ